MKKKILYIVPHRLNRSPGQRFRCEHFIPWLEQNGFETTYANLLTEWDDKHFYAPRNYLIKLFIVLKSFIRRWMHIRSVKKYNLVFIYREAFMLGTLFFEKSIKRKRIPIIFDFDDAIWLNDVSDGNKELKWLKRPSKTNDICQMASLVITGNQYLANHASQFNDKVVIVPTTIDTRYHKPSGRKKIKETVCIGWTGTSTTLKHYRTLIPVLVRLKEKFGERITFRVISDVSLTCSSLMVENIKWNNIAEIEQLEQIDIGIMPLPNDKWAKGKCGFKGLQYMALGIPAVLSPVGVNTEIVTDGVTGFLAGCDVEWFEKLSQLIEDGELRKKLGEAGRIVVENRFSVFANRERYLELFFRF